VSTSDTIFFISISKTPKMMFIDPHIAKFIYDKKRSGWMFKINFLVLFFTTFGEANMSNTVNLKFLHLLKNEDDIGKMDWCTYIIELLIKTERSWKRDGFYNGPILLLLV
jgi:hypothetical protein